METDVMRHHTTFKMEIVRSGAAREPSALNVVTQARVFRASKVGRRWTS